MATVSVDLETMVGNDNSLINERWELVAWPESTTGAKLSVGGYRIMRYGNIQSLQFNIDDVPVTPDSAWLRFQIPCLDAYWDFRVEAGVDPVVIDEQDFVLPNPVGPTREQMVIEDIVLYSLGL